MSDSPRKRVPSDPGMTDIVAAADNAKQLERRYRGLSTVTKCFVLKLPEGRE
jgi:hypothetical protein